MEDDPLDRWIALDNHAATAVLDAPPPAPPPVAPPVAVVAPAPAPQVVAPAPVAPPAPLEDDPLDRLHEGLKDDESKHLSEDPKYDATQYVISHGKTNDAIEVAAKANYLKAQKHAEKPLMERTIGTTGDIIKGVGGEVADTWRDITSPTDEPKSAIGSFVGGVVRAGANSVGRIASRPAGIGVADTEGSYLESMGKKIANYDKLLAEDRQEKQDYFNANGTLDGYNSKIRPEEVVSPEERTGYDVTLGGAVDRAATLKLGALKGGENWLKLKRNLRIDKNMSIDQWKNEILEDVGLHETAEDIKTGKRDESLPYAKGPEITDEERKRLISEGIIDPSGIELSSAATDPTNLALGEGLRAVPIGKILGKGLQVGGDAAKVVADKTLKALDKSPLTKKLVGGAAGTIGAGAVYQAYHGDFTPLGLALGALALRVGMSTVPGAVGTLGRSMLNPEEFTSAAQRSMAKEGMETAEKGTGAKTAMEAFNENTFGGAANKEAAGRIARGAAGGALTGIGASAPFVATADSPEGVGRALAGGGIIGGAGGAGSDLNLSKNRASGINKAATQILAEKGADIKHPDADIQKATDDAMAKLAPTERTYINAIKGLLSQFKGKTGQQVSVSILPADQYAKFSGGDTTSRGMHDTRTGQIYLNADALNVDTAGHEAGHFITDEVIKQVGGAYGDVLSRVAGEGLFKGNKPTPEFQAFIDKYNENAPKNIDGTLGKEAILNNKAVQEYLAETTRYVLGDENIGKFTMPKDVSDHIADSLADYYSKQIPGAGGTKTAFDRTDLPMIHQAIKNMVFDLGKGMKPAPVIPETPEQKSAREKAESDTERDAAHEEAGLNLHDTDSMRKNARDEAEAAYVNRVGKRKMNPADKEAAKKAEGDKAEADIDYRLNDLVDSLDGGKIHPSHDAQRALLIHENNLENGGYPAHLEEMANRQRPPTPEEVAAAKEKAKSDREAAYKNDNPDLVVNDPLPDEPQPGEFGISAAQKRHLRNKGWHDEQIDAMPQHQVDEEVADMPQPGPALSKITPGAAPEPGQAGGVLTGAEARGRGVPTVDDSARAIAHYPEGPQKEAVKKLAANRGNLQWLRGYFSPETQGEGEQRISKAERDKDIAADKAKGGARNRTQGQIQDVPFIPTKITMGKKGPYASGFRPDLWRNNIEQIRDALVKNGKEDPFAGLEGKELDQAIEDAMATYTRNHVKGITGAGDRPIKIPGAGYNMKPAEPGAKGEKLPQRVADLMSMALEGKLDEKAQKLMDANQGTPNPLRAEIGDKVGKLSTPHSENVIAENITEGVHDTPPDEVRSVRPSAHDIDFGKVFKDGRPSYEAASSDFMPRDKRADKERIGSGGITSGERPILAPSSGDKKDNYTFEPARKGSSESVEDKGALTKIQPEGDKGVDSSDRSEYAPSPEDEKAKSILSSLMKDDEEPVAEPTTPTNEKDQDIDPRTKRNTNITGSRVTAEQSKKAADALSESSRRYNDALRSDAESGDDTASGEAPPTAQLKDFGVVRDTSNPTGLVSTDPNVKLLGKGGEAVAFRDGDVVYKIYSPHPDGGMGITGTIYQDPKGSWMLDYDSGTLGETMKKLALSSKMGGVPSEISGLTPNGTLIVKQPVYPDKTGTKPRADMSRRQNFDTAHGKAQVEKIDPDAKSDNKMEGVFDRVAVIDGEPYAVTDLKGDNYTLDNAGNFRISDPIITKMPPEMLESLPALKAQVERMKAEENPDRAASDFMPDAPDTKEFKDWFAGSKVVDENGNPKVLVHGTRHDWKIADTDRMQLGIHLGSPEQSGDAISGTGYYDQRSMPLFARIENPIRLPDRGIWDYNTIKGDLEDAGIKIPDSVQKEFEAQNSSKGDYFFPKDHGAYNAWSNRTVKKLLNNAGYDGVVYLNRTEGVDHVAMDKELGGRVPKSRDDYTDELLKKHGAEDSYIALDPNQIKSATGNTGEFNPSSRRIDFMPNEDDQSPEAKRIREIDEKLKGISWYGPDDKDRAQRREEITALRDERGTNENTILRRQEDEAPKKATGVASGGEVVPESITGNDPEGSTPYNHWSNQPGLETLSPNSYGTAAAGAERARKDAHPDRFVNRTYVGLPGYEKESPLGKHKYEGTIDKSLLYDIEKDPGDLKSLAAKAVRQDPTRNFTTEYEKLIKDHGYLGYQRNKVAALFHDIPTGQHVGPEEFAASAPDHAAIDPNAMRDQRDERNASGQFDHKLENLAPTNQSALSDFMPDTGEPNEEKTTEGSVPVSQFSIDPERRGHEFRESIAQAQKDHPYGSSVTVHPEDFYTDPSKKVYLGSDGMSGALVDKDGSLQSVFKNPNSKLREINQILADAAKGAKSLDAYDIGGKLPTMYGEYGFEPVARLKFNDDYAPDGWDYDKMGRPDVVFMAKNADAVTGDLGDYNKVRDSVPEFDNWDDAFDAMQKAVEEMNPKAKGPALEGISPEDEANLAASDFMPDTGEEPEKKKGALSKVIPTTMRKPGDPNIPVTSALNILDNPKSEMGKFAEEQLNPKTRQSATNSDIALRLGEQAIKNNGRMITSKDITPDEFDMLVRNGTDEGEAAVKRKVGKNAQVWYTDNIADGMAAASAVHPELHDPKIAKASGFDKPDHAETALALALAITSQGIKVEPNARNAEYQFEHLKKTFDPETGVGKFDETVGYGKSKKSQQGNFALANDLLKKLGGWEGMQDFLSKEFTVKELKAAMKEAVPDRDVSVDGYANDIVSGSAIFGPKIGNGFFQNLIGNFNPLTVDMWARRTWGRWTGHSLSEGITPQRVARLVDSLKGLAGYKMPDALKGIKVTTDEKGNRYISENAVNKILGSQDLKDQINRESLALEAKWQKMYKDLQGTRLGPKAREERAAQGLKDIENGITKEQMAGLKDGTLTLDEIHGQMQKNAAEREAAWKKYDGDLDKQMFVAEMKAKQGETERLSNKQMSDAKPEWAKASGVIAKQLKPIDAPTAKDYQLISRVFRGIQQGLAERGIHLSNADVQALLWYPEKDIWAKLAGKKESSLNTSYDSAFLKIADERGLGKEARARIEQSRSERRQKRQQPD